MKAWSEDMQVRLHGLEPAIPSAYVVHVHEVKPGEIYRDAPARFSAFQVRHGIWKYAYGYRIEAGGKSIVIPATLR